MTALDTATDASAASINRGHRVLFRILTTLFRGLSRLFLRLSIEGRENLPRRGGYVVAPGAHRSIIDTAVIAVTPQDTMFRFMGAESYFETPGLGLFLRALGGFPVVRSSTDREAMRLAEDVLRSGEPLVIFPESTRFSGPEVQPLKDGAAFIAARAGVPLVPIGIGGGERAWPKGQKLPRPKRMSIIVGEPIYPTQRAPGERVKRTEVRRLTADLQASLQVLFDRAQGRIGL
ncbi:MAG: lysophospholipid acyltransferase family protein [Acidimicrobiales bacterium]